MRRIVLAVLLGLAGCGGNVFSLGGDPSPAGDWQLPSGQPPSRTDFAAVMAACQDRTHSSGDDRAVETCLVRDYGLHRVR